MLQLGDDPSRTRTPEVIKQVVAVPASPFVSYLDQPRPDLFRWRIDGYRSRGVERRARDKVLDWESRNLIVAHGVRPGAIDQRFLIKSFRWLGA